MERFSDVIAENTMASVCRNCFWSAEPELHFHGLRLLPLARGHDDFTHAALDHAALALDRPGDDGADLAAKTLERGAGSFQMLLDVAGLVQERLAFGNLQTQPFFFRIDLRK